MGKPNLIGQVRELLTTMPDTLKYDVLASRKKQIVAIAELCKKDELYRKTERHREDFCRPLKNVPIEQAALMAWVHFLDRMVNAPTAFHMRGAVVVVFPIVGDLLRGKRP